MTSDSRHCYQIRIEGLLSAEWSDWFDGLSVAGNQPHQGETLLLGYLPDQAALHGVLNRIRDLGLTLVAVNRCSS